ncbi:MAG: class I SAM-dependent methyltransferase [Desulfobacterales bacterium]
MSNQTLSMTPAINDYLHETGFREHPVLKELREATRNHPFIAMQIAPEQGALMQLLVGLTGARRCIEVGTFTGYSALATALALPDDGQLICCDVSEEWTAIGKPFWAKAGMDHKIDLRIAPGMETLNSLSDEAGTFDWAFIDADKENYPDYYEKSLALVRAGGLILIDNALWAGGVVDPQSEESKIIDRLNRLIFSDKRVEMVLLPLGDGLLIARKN